jgi:ABC-type glycerol-3-phosphate transport system substrate-binding protein
MFKKKLQKMLGVALAVTLMGSVALTGCGKSGGDGADKGDSGADAGKDGDKPTVTLMIDIAGFPPLNTAVQMVQEKFPEYNIVSKPWNLTELGKTIKTTFASGGNESIDIAFSSCRQLQSYKDADMLLDLTPYLEEDPEWKNSVFENMLDAATFDGKVYAMPWQAAYPVMICNNAILKEVGVKMTDDMSYDELMAAAKELKEAGYAPFGLEGASNWILVQSYLNAFDTEEDMQAFANGEILFTDARVKAAFDKAAEVYNNNYFYLGEGALAATNDEVVSGFANKQIACVFSTNSAAKNVLEMTKVEDYTIVAMPSFSNTGMQNLLGAPDCYFVPANVQDKEATIEVLKYLTSTEVMQAMVDAGAVVANKNVDTSDEFYSVVSNDIDRMHPDDPVKLSDEINDYIAASALAEYIYSGDAVLEKLDGMLEKLK